MCVLPLVFGERLDGRAPPNAGADDLAGKYARLRTYHGAALDTHMIAKAHLPADYAIVFYDDAAGNSGLGGDDASFADSHVVTDLDEVVDLCACPDAGFTQSPAVNARVGADLYVVLDNGRSYLREFQILSVLIADITEPVGADDHARMQDHTVSERGVIFEGNISVQHAIVAGRNVIAYIASGTQLAAAADS